MMKPSSCKTGKTNWQEICGFYTHSECMLLLKTQLLFFFYLHLSTHSFFLLLIWIWVTWAQMPRPPSFCNVSKPPVRCNLSFMSWVFFGASLWWDMPEISHLIRCPNLNLPPLDVEEWRLYFESLAIWAQTPFGWSSFLVLISAILFFWSVLTDIGEGRTVDVQLHNSR